ncbi:MAG: histidine kinase [Comamonadaceae bacterium]|nr:histidine kinase [Comamonadaceae bacterium]
MPAADAPIRLLVVEDSELDYELLQAILLRDRETLGGRVRTQRAEDEAGMRAAFARGPVDAVITDHNLPRFDSLRRAEGDASEIDPDLPVIVLSGEMSEELAVASLHAGRRRLHPQVAHVPARPGAEAQPRCRRCAARPARRLCRAGRKRGAAARTHARIWSAIKEEERRALAREVHDDIGSTLTALKFELARLAKDLGERPLAAPRILAMQELLAHAVAGQPPHPAQPAPAGARRRAGRGAAVAGARLHRAHRRAGAVRDQPRGARSSRPSTRWRCTGSGRRRSPTSPSTRRRGACRCSCSPRPTR